MLRTALPKPVAPALLALAASLGIGWSASAQTPVTSVGDVSPIDSPFIPGDQGIPSSGNTVQTVGTDAAGNPLDAFGNILLDEDGRVVGQFNYERSVNIEVGRFSSGSLTMVDGATLRVGDLAIGGTLGGSFTSPANLNIRNGDFGGGTTGGNGLVQIVGVGSVFNNHPLIIPTQFQDFGTGAGDGNPEQTGFFVPDTYNPDPVLGGITGPADTITNIRRTGSDEFDLYVGLSGNGTLEISQGGRAEIRDGAFIGAAPSATGRVTVDGAGSYLGVYGNKSPVSNPTADGEATLIGPYGTGQLEVLNGGNVDLFNRASLGSVDGAGGVGDAGGAAGGRGGSGTILIDGPGSLLRVMTPGGAGVNAAALAVGRFFGSGSDPTRVGSFFSTASGLDDEGSGTVTIRNGGLLRVMEDPGNNVGEANRNAEMRIGRFGIVELSDGRIEIDSALDNDGTIRTSDGFGGVEASGDAEIDLEVFLNSPFGVVEVTAGSTLHLRSRGNNARSIQAGTLTDNYYFGNSGRISVQGDDALGKATFIADRVALADGGDGSFPSEFRNFTLTGVPGVATGGGDVPLFDIPGVIEAQDATLDFRSGLINSGKLLFTGGDNVLYGFVENDPLGDVAISGDASVTFTDVFVNNGELTVTDEGRVMFADTLSMASPTSLLRAERPTVITVADDALINGELALAFGGGGGATDFAQLQVLGDAFFDSTTATIDLTRIGFSGLAAGDTFDLITVDGIALGLPTLVGDTTIEFEGTLRQAISGPVVDGEQLFLVADNDMLSDSTYTLTVVSTPAPPPLVITADVTGDGFIDTDDVQAWFDNFPVTPPPPATLAQGDVDGDGDVDLTDLHFILGLLGTAAPGAGAGAVAVAPEPTAAVLALLAAASLGLPRRRQG